MDITNLGTEKDPIWDWCIGDRHYTCSNSSFIKRQLFPHERRLNIWGKPAEQPFNAERLENEKNALLFIKEHTRIPVPTVISWEMKDDTRILTMQRLDGALAFDLLDDEDTTLSSMQKVLLKNKIDTFITDLVLPELSKLRSYRLGQLSGVLFPPPRVSAVDTRLSWRPKTASRNKFVYCHNDLGLYNILVDTETLEPTGVIDWEYSGFFPPVFEKPLWLSGEKAPLDENEGRKLAKLLDEHGTLFLGCAL